MALSETKLLSVARPRLAKLLQEEQGRQELLWHRESIDPLSFGDVAKLRLREIADDVSTKPRTKLY